MTYENSLVFGKNASIINEAYSKMYSDRHHSTSIKGVNEATKTPEDKELYKNDLGLSDEQREYIKNFDADKEYNEIIDAERRGNDDENVDVDEPASVSTYQDTDDDDEDTQNFMSSFNSKQNRDAGQGGGDDFVLSFSRYDDQLKRRYPDWLIKAANAANHELPIRGKEPTTFGGHGAKVKTLVQNTSGDGNENGDDGTPWENLWDNIIVAHPEIFNEENYDMEELPKHKKEFHAKWEEYFLDGIDEIESAKRALEEIPGCECKVRDEEEFIGNIDGDDSSEDEFEEVEPYASHIGKKGFGIVVKSYERDFSPGARQMKFVARYITPPQFKGVVFDSKDEAIEALRDYMAELIGEPSDVCVGVVIDHGIVDQILNSDGKTKLNSTVYTISSSDKENTQRSIAYETNDWTSPHICDEYLQ